MYPRELETILMQDLDSFAAQAVSCFSSDFFRMLSESKATIRLWPMICSDGRCSGFSKLRVICNDGVNASLDMGSFSELESRFMEYFTFNDGGARKNLGVENHVQTDFIDLHFADGKIKVESLFPVIENLDSSGISFLKYLESNAGLDFKLPDAQTGKLVAY